MQKNMPDQTQSNTPQDNPNLVGATDSNSTKKEISFNKKLFSIALILIFLSFLLFIAIKFKENQKNNQTQPNSEQLTVPSPTKSPYHEVLINTRYHLYMTRDPRTEKRIIWLKGDTDREILAVNYWDELTDIYWSPDSSKVIITAENETEIVYYYINLSQKDSALKLSLFPGEQILGWWDDDYLIIRKPLSLEDYEYSIFSVTKQNRESINTSLEEENLNHENTDNNS